MGLRERFNDALKEAMKARDQKRIGTLRLVLAAVKERDISSRADGTREVVGDEDILQVLAKMIKQREESAQMYESGGRPELAENERAEIAVIREFQPRQMDEAEVGAAVSAVIGEVGAASLKDMGAVMAELKARYAGQMDFSKASALVKGQLSGGK